MEMPGPFTIVIPTRNGAEACRETLEFLARENADVQLDLRVVFLVNDTQQESTRQLEAVARNESFASLRPLLLYAKEDYPTPEFNIRATLGNNLDAVDERFLIIVDTDRVVLSNLREGLDYFAEHRLDLMLIGEANREVSEGVTLREMYGKPQHITRKNRLSEHSCHGRHIYSDSMTDTGPVNYHDYYGCQLYSKNFFRKLCAVLAELPEPLYSFSLATLELTTREEFEVGFFPAVITIRVEHQTYIGTAPQDPVNWWVYKHKTDRGLSRHQIISVITNSLHLCQAAFNILVNSQTATIRRGQPLYYFSNFLFDFVHEVRNNIRDFATDPTLRYSLQEQQDIVRFGERLGQVDIGLAPEQRELISTWLQYFGVIGKYEDPARIGQLMSGSNAVLRLLDTRAGMESWYAQQLASV
jgi:hypothetical protein